MATTIKLKNGSGAPATSDLVQGEPAIDLTNRRLYTENASGAIIEVGSNPSSLSIAGTAVTATAAELNILDGVTSTAAELNILDGVTSTAAELNILDGVTSTTAELNILDGVTSTTAELNFVDGVTSNIQTQLNTKGTGSVSSLSDLSITATAAELNILDGVTSTAAELNILDGVTSTAAELNIMDGVTSSTAELNILDGVTSTTAELNILDGVTSTAVELNILDGVTSSTAELNILDGVTSTAAELNILDGVTSTAAELNVLDGVTAFLDEDNFASNSATAIPSQQSVKAYVTSSVTAAGGLSNVVEDTTPQLGGSLDVNGQDIVSVSNGNITLTPNGSGLVRLDGNVDIQSGEIVLKNAGSVSNVKFYCESSNAHYTQLQSSAHSAYSGNVTLTLPPATDTLVGKATTDTLTNKTLTSPKINEDVAVTSTATEINLLDGVTSTTAELNILDGVTSTAAELNILDGVTATTAELNYVDGVTSAIQTQLDAKAAVASPTFTGTVTIPTADINGGNIDGTTIGGSTAAAGTFTTFTSNGIDDNADATAITIDSSERVLIGTDSGDAFNDSASLRIQNASGASYIQVKTPNDQSGGLLFGDTDDDFRGGFFYDNSTDHLAVYANDAERMRIDSSGDVGIGISDPLYKLQVAGATADADGALGSQSPQFSIQGGNNNNQFEFGMDNSGGTAIGFLQSRHLSAGAQTIALNPAGGSVLIGSSDTSSWGASGRLRLYNNSAQDAIKLYQAAAGTAALWCRIDATSNYFAVWRYGGSTVGTITTNGSSTSYNTSSDYRLKKNIVDLDNAIERVKQIPVRRFSFIVEPDVTVDCFLAHEVADTVPEAITGTKDETKTEEYEITPAVMDDDDNVVTAAVMGTREVPVYQGIDQSKLVPLLTAALQEAVTRIETLESEVAALQGAN